MIVAIVIAHNVGREMEDEPQDDIRAESTFETDQLLRLKSERQPTSL